MSKHTRDDSGQFVETVTPERVLAVMRRAEPPVVTASDIAEELDCTPEAVTQKLKRLQEQERVARQKVGARAVVWWIVDRGPTLREDGEHDHNEPFFAAQPLDAEGATPIPVADTDDLLGDALAEE